MKATWLSSVVAGAVMTLTAGAASGWNLPQDNGTMQKSEVAEILASSNYAETTR
ncbi:MAG: hypothetical protein JWQ00_263, partial [Noviherbaspirillum sp.]|nr:hypothetical protein [Noviherbaspirillum sp.]